MWIITRDYLTEENGEDKSVGEFSRVGKHSWDYNPAGFSDAEKVQVRLLDDDEEVYYEALSTRERIYDSDGDRAFDILDWGMADAGCTELQYLDDNGNWQTL
jgi:hypothetical protein